MSLIYPCFDFIQLLIFWFVYLQSIDPRMSTYDLIASLHSGQAARMMHNGPAFLPRHMVYLLV